MEPRSNYRVAEKVGGGGGRWREREKNHKNANIQFVIPAFFYFIKNNKIETIDSTTRDFCWKVWCRWGLLCGWNSKGLSSWVFHVWLDFHPLSIGIFRSLFPNDRSWRRSFLMKRFMCCTVKALIGNRLLYFLFTIISSTFGLPIYLFYSANFSQYFSTHIL